MDVSNYQFSDEEIARFHQYRDNQDNARLKARFIALLLLAEGIEIHKVASVIGKSIKTIENWHRQYRSKGIESLNFFQYKPKQSYLNDEQIEQLVSWVKTTNPAKLKQVRQYIKDNWVEVSSNNGGTYTEPTWWAAQTPERRKFLESRY